MNRTAVDVLKEVYDQLRRLAQAVNDAINDPTSEANKTGLMARRDTLQGTAKEIYLKARSIGLNLEDDTNVVGLSGSTKGKRYSSETS